jgi:hypothetical protein
MRRLFPILRCKCARCVAARRRRFFTILAFCIAIVGSWKLLVEEHKPVPGSDQYLPDAIEETSSFGFNGSYNVEQSPERAGFRIPSYATNAGASDTTSYLGSPRLSPERMNAALAAGLIDPAGIEPVAPVVLAPSAQEQALTSSVPAINIPNTTLEKESMPQVKNVAATGSVTPPAANPTGNASLLAPASYKIVSASPGRKADAANAEPPDNTTPAPRHPEPHAKSSNPAMKKFAARLFARAGTGSIENSPAEENVSRTVTPANETKSESPPKKKVADRGSQSPDLSENLQQFAADFVRANQTDNFTERHRFFSDSVHFYSEGDLSLASVDAATRRHHREQQTKRTEVAEPGAATGPVNGGFYEIEQPVRWTQSQGSQVKQGRSVLRLRVVPVGHGSWKITSIDEVNK